MLVTVCSAIASIWDRPLAGFAIASTAYIAWCFFQLNRIMFWLGASPDVEPPEAGGLWGIIFDGIYHLQRHDREEKDRLQATIQYLQDSFSSLPDAVVMIDKRGNIVWCNKFSESLLGLYYPQDKNQYIGNLVRDPKFTDYFEKEIFDQHLELTSPNNPYITLQVQVTFFGKRDKLVFARDITTMMQLECMRRDFIANVSHELRTPLTVIRGYLETFQDFLVSDDERWLSALNQMIEQSHRMDALVRDLMVLSRLETVPESEEPALINVKNITDTICNELSAAGIDARQLINECPDDACLMGNPEEIHSAFSNLLTNAVRYTDGDGLIRVSWSEKNKISRYSVRDNGIGIDFQHIPRLTERFYRVEKSRSVNAGGTGLGLAIVKHILIRHNASLKIESLPGHGSTFTCEFPQSAGLDD